ncbi:MAG TPA: glycosyltransferase family 2 protein [Acidimicrobiales bacterium]|nr:glycosyltransferase family 2 protein [Acidimicrobiales bacterium]
MPPPRVRLVVLNYNGGDLVTRCVDHLERLDWPEDRLDIVVVDNASTDGSEAPLEERPRVRLIRSRDNVGFPGNNLGLTDLDGIDYVGLINNDAFVTRSYLAPLVAALEADRHLGAACPKILLAPRFRDLSLRSPTWVPEGDGRALGVRLSGVRVAGTDRSRHAVYAAGLFAPERGGAAEPEFRWTGAEALIRVPVDAVVAPEAGDGGEAAASVDVRLAAGRVVPVVLDGGAGPVSVEVGPEPRWFTVALAGPAYDVVNNAGSDLVNGSWGGDRGFLERDEGQYDEARDVFAWCGAGVLFRRAYLEDVGLFDERFFMYYEDTDLSWRGRARGWRYHLVPDAVLRHVHAATSVEGSPLFHHYVERNRLVMLTKNAPWRLASGAAGHFVLSTASYARRDVVRPALRGRRPSLGLVAARARSFGAYVRLLPAVLPDRRRLRSGQVVPDEAITGWSVPR